MQGFPVALSPGFWSLPSQPGLRLPMAPAGSWPFLKEFAWISSMCPFFYVSGGPAPARRPKLIWKHNLPSFTIYLLRCRWTEQPELRPAAQQLHHAEVRGWAPAEHFHHHRHSRYHPQEARGCWWGTRTHIKQPGHASGLQSTEGYLAQCPPAPTPAPGKAVVTTASLGFPSSRRGPWGWATQSSPLVAASKMLMLLPLLEN